MYLLHDPEMVGTMRGITDACIPDDIQTGTIISEPTKTLHALLAEITDWAKQTQHEDKVATTIETNKLLSAISNGITNLVNLMPLANASVSLAQVHTMPTMLHNYPQDTILIKKYRTHKSNMPTSCANLPPSTIARSSPFTSMPA